MRPRSLTAALLFAAAACSTRPPAAPEPVPQPPRIVELGADGIATVARILELEDRRVFDPAVFTRAAGYPIADVRERALLAAGRTRDARALPLLIAGLTDSVASVSAIAAFALGEFADTTAQAVQPLVHVLQERAYPTATRAQAARALGVLGARAGRAALEAALAATPHADEDAVVEQALLAIWRLPRTPSSVQAVVAQLESRSDEIHWRAVYALMRMADPATVNVMLPLLASDSSSVVRANVARMLRAPVVDSAGMRTAVASALLQALADPHPHVAINAVRALATFRDAAHLDAIVALLDETDSNLAIAAAQALGDHGSSESAGALRAVAEAGAGAGALRAQALASLVRVSPQAGAELTRAWAERPDWLGRFYAARALGAAPWSAAQSGLRALVRDSDPRVAAEALTSVVASGDTAASAYAFYLEGLASADHLVRAAALRGLERRASAADLPALLQAYERALLDADNDAALAAVAALGRLAEIGVPVARTFFLRFRSPADPAVRAAVGRSLGPQWGVEAGEVQTRLLTRDYEALVRAYLAPESRGPAPRVRIQTEKGDIVIELQPAYAPMTVHNFLSLVQAGFYQGPDLRWHRVVPNFVLQDGDPRGDGSGGTGYAIRDEINPLEYERGMVGMALSGPDTGGGQYFITHSPQPHLDGGYTIFGRVVAGMDVADAIVQDDRILAIEVLP